MNKKIDSFVGKWHGLSNFAELDSGKTIEHYFQAMKTTNWEWQIRILFASTPGGAKFFGRKAPLREGWDDMRINVMRSLLEKKFSEPKFKVLLLSTEISELVEGNHWGDVFWGKCDGIGKNHLGRLLMEIREDIWESNFESGTAPQF